MKVLSVPVKAICQLSASTGFIALQHLPFCIRMYHVSVAVCSDLCYGISTCPPACHKACFQ